MSNEVTIDELRIEIEAESGTAASNLDDLAKSLDRLQTVTQRMTGGGDGLNKVAKQIEKLNAISQNIRSMRGFERLGKVVNQLSKLDRLSNVGDISGLVRNLNKLPQAVNAIAQMPSIDATKFQQIADALKPLNDLGTNNINSFLRTLGKFPQTAQQLAGVDLTQFEQQIRRISTSLEPLTRQAERGGAGLTALAQIMQSTSRQARQSSDGVGLFNQTLGQIKVKTLAAIAGLRRLFSVLKSSVTTSNDYVENLNLFTVTMGGAADEALRFANTVNDLMGIDVSQWIQNQGVFKQMASGFGMVDEKANLLSKNLTQIGYDIASYYNISTESAMQKLQSGLAGEIMPLRSLGYALDEATIKQVALNHGITESVTNMSQAQKAQLRYIAIMEQSTNAMGDMARTIDSPANQIRILEARIQTLKRAIGDSLMPVVSAALPYITAFVQILGEAFRGLAEFMGFELPKFDYSDVVTKGNKDIANSFDDATEASNKFKGTLAGIDQLNIIGSKDDGKSSAGGENQFDLGIELPEYDFLQGVESKTKQIVDDIKAIMPWVEALGSAIAGAFAFSKISKFTDGLKNIASIFGKNIPNDKLKGFSKTLGGIVGGLAAGASSGILLNSGIKNLITGTGKLGNNIAMLVGGLGIAGGAIATFIKLGNPLGAVITGIGAAIGTVSGICKGLQENADRAAEAIMSNELYNNGGTRIDEIADAFGRLTDKAVEINQEFVNKYDAVHQYDTKMQELSETIQEIAGFDLNLDNITFANAEKLKEPFDELCGYLKTTFETEVQTVADDIARIFTDLNLSDTIGAEMQAAYRQMKIQMSDELSESQKTVDQYLERIQSGEHLSNTDMAAFKNNFAYVTEKSLTGNESYQNLQRAFDDLDLSKIDELSSIEAQEKLNAISDKYDEYLKSWQDRYDAEINSINNLKSDLDSRLKYGLIDTDTYNARMDLLTNSGNLFAEYASQQVKDMSQKAASITDQIIDQSIFAADKSAAVRLKANPFDDIMAQLADMDKYDYAAAQTLIDNPVYALAQALNAKFVSTSVDVAVNTTFATEGGAETWKILTKELNPNIDAEIGRIQDATGNLKYIVGTEQALIDAKVDAIKSDSEGWKILIGEKTAQIKAELVNSPFTAEYKAFLSKDSITPTYTDMDEVYKKIQQTNASLGGSSYQIPTGYGPVAGTIMGAARESVSNATQTAAAMAGLEMAANFTIYNVTELDDEIVAESVTRTQQRQMVYSNGR